MLRKIALVWVAVFACSLLANAAGPANVIHEEEGACGMGWFGCGLDDAILLPDGTWDCPASALRFVFIQGDFRGVEANDEHGNAMFVCSSTYRFNQINPTGFGDPAPEVVAVPIETWCLFLPDSCPGNGAVIINPRTVGSLATCGNAELGVTTNMHMTVTPSGNTRLRCYWPDLPSGG